ncbi:895bce3e-a1f3-4324-ae1d-430ef10d0c0b [Sclerotinia trifoliorum]|uniref:895bce3e-a1f3-4324-ae1d-430ef10d0c0b n=1 Tax=Sclerotinia trifoliorum TaxID=28548 RepID=A0A8H2ZNN8_9HELO|nr:895bce3e-a1f3-4324-ae1d-430ef10d0c0b [Sclerotinia trifoliorum]
MKTQFLNRASTLNGQYRTAFENWFCKLTSITEVHTGPRHLTRCDDCITPQCLFGRYNGVLAEYHENLSLKYVPTKPRDRLIKSTNGDGLFVPWSQTPFLQKALPNRSPILTQTSAEEYQHSKKYTISNKRLACQSVVIGSPIVASQSLSVNRQPLVFWSNVGSP